LGKTGKNWPWRMRSWGNPPKEQQQIIGKSHRRSSYGYMKKKT